MEERRLTWRERYEKEQAWGILSSIDIRDCKKERITDENVVRDFAAALCDVIDMKAYGDPLVAHFGKGEVEGFSLVQLIETSLISGHFANESNRAFIDIFSCRYYEPEEAAVFCMEYFQGKQYRLNVQLRK